MLKVITRALQNMQALWWSLLLIGGLLSACDVAPDVTRDLAQAETQPEASADEANADVSVIEKLAQSRPGAAYRIQLNLELKETGEPINFDYMVRCSNIDVPGSFHPIISGQTHFKALSTGAAVAASAPSHYCKRSLSNQPFNKPGDPMKMPVVAWYDDVNDLSRTWAYLTNDAYKSPLAKVRFVDYAVSRATKDEYRVWAEETSRNYKQIGAIPGPFGCMTGNALSSEPQSCAFPETLERNGGKFLQVIDDGLLERHLYSIPFVTEGFDIEALKEEFAAEGSYSCSQLWKSVLKDEDELRQQEGRVCHTSTGKCPTRKKVKGKHHPSNINRPEYAQGFWKKQYSNFIRLKDRRLVNYLDSTCLKGEGNCDIRKVHPVIPVRTPKGLVFRMLRKPSYQGFSIQSTEGFFPDDFGGFTPTGFRTPGGWADTGVLFVNEELVCDKAGRIFTFSDWEQLESIRTTTQY